MSKRLARAVGAASLTALAAFTTAAAATGLSLNSADNPLCDTAKRYSDAGHLDRAEAIYISVPAKDDPTDCALKGMTRVATARQEAVKAVTAGQQMVRQGKLADAEKKFGSALEIDRSNAAAAAGISRVEELRNRALPTASSNWDRFYDDWVSPIGKLSLFIAIGLGVLLSASGILSGSVVKVGAVAWSKPERYVAGGIGLVLILGTAVLFPVYAMFKPFVSGSPLLYAAAGLVLVIVGLTTLLVEHVSRRLSKDVLLRHRKQVWLDWWFLPCSLALIAVAAVILSLTALTEPDVRMGVAYAVLGLFGVLLTAAVLGQNLHLQVEAQSPDGKTDAAATDYLLGRMQTLGTESPKGIHIGSALASTPLSKLASEDLSALPTGPIAGALSRLFWALRPGLTWRARVTLVDDNRVAITVSRNGRHAESAIFSRLDLGLPPIRADSPAEASSEPSALDTASAQERAVAQLLTGAAAFILLHLSKVHLHLQGGLCGARNWKSVTLQVIATSKSLIDQRSQCAALLSRAMKEDPGYVLARFEYLWAVYQATPAEITNYKRFATEIDRQYVASGLDDKDDGWQPLRIRVLYSRATQWLNYYVEQGRSDHSALTAAVSAATTLKEACEKDYNGDKIWEFAEQMRPFAANLHHSIMVLNEETGIPKHDPEDAQWLHPHDEFPPSPLLAYDHACLDCFLMEVRNQPALADQAMDDLQFALATTGDRDSARTDPCFKPLYSKDRFRRLVGPTEFLDLPLFESYKERLKSAGLTTSYELARRSETEAQRSELAAYLKTSLVLVDQFRDLAQLAQFDPDLDDAEMLWLLLSAGVNSPDSLRRKAQQDAILLVRTLRDSASQCGLAQLRGVRKPQHWLVNAGVSKRKATWFGLRPLR